MRRLGTSILLALATTNCAGELPGEDEDLGQSSAALSTPTGANLVILPRPPARTSSIFRDDWIAPFSGSGATLARVTSPRSEGTHALSVTLGAAGTALAATVNTAEAAYSGAGQTELSFAFQAGTSVHAGVASLAVAVEDDDPGTTTTWVALKPYLTSGTVAANTWYQVTIPMTALNPGQRPIRRVLVGNSTKAGARFLLDHVRMTWTDANPTETLAYGDAPGTSFLIDGWDSHTTTTTFRTTGDSAIQGAFDAAWSAVSFTRDWNLAPYAAGTHTTVSFDISPGASSVPAAMRSMLVGLDGDPRMPLTSAIPGGLVANTWHRVTLPVSALVTGPYREVTFKNETETTGWSFFVDHVRFQVDHAPPPLRVSGPEPPVYGPATCTALTRRDRAVGGKATDEYLWRDRTCGARSAALVRADAKGGHAVEFSYPFGSATRVVGIAPEWGSVLPAGGFGYVVSHLANGDVAWRHGDDDSPLGSALGNTHAVVFQGTHHAIHQFTVNYPRWGTWNGVDVKYDMPVTIQWAFRTGSDHPVYAITFDLEAAPANAVLADMRAPYGAMNYDGAAVGTWGDVVGGIAWGDTHRFTTLGTAGLTMNSAWTWNVANTGPAYNSQWTRTVDAELGVVATHVLRKMDAGGYAHGATGRGSTSAAGARCASDDGYGGLAHTMPCASNWSFQSVNWGFYDDDGNPEIAAPTDAKRHGWGSDWGTLGASSMTTVNGNVVKGHAKVSYSTFVALDAHSKAPTANAAEQVSVVDATRITATVGAVRTSGPAGVNRTDAMTYSPAGYSPVLGTWEVDAASNAVDLGIAAPATAYLENPTFVIHGYTRTTAPASVKLDGVTLAANQGYFASVRAGTQDLWLTLNAKVRGAGHRLSVQ